MGKTNLIITNGYYTCIVGISILKQLGIELNNSYLFSYFKHTDQETYNEDIRIINKSWNFLNVFNYFNYIDKSNGNFIFNDLKKDINDLNILNILIPINSSTKKWYKIFNKIYPNSRFIFFEEGLLSYIKPIFDFKLNNILKHYDCFYNYFNNGMNYLLYNNLYNSNIKLINNDHFIQACKELRSSIDVDLYSLNLDKSKNILFLPQYYYNNNKNSYNKKLLEYLEIIMDLSKKGYKILIKDHPKYNSNIFSYIKHYINPNNIINLSDINNFPVELFLKDLNLKAIFSVYSTSLFVCSSNIFNVPCFTSYKMLKDRANTLSLYPYISCILVKKLFPDIKDVLDNNFSSEKFYYDQYKEKIEYNKFKNFNFLNLFLSYIFRFNF